MFAESKLTFAAWTGFGITAASIGTVVYKRSNGFVSLEQKNPGTGNNLIKKLTEEDSEKQKPKEKDLEGKKQNLPESVDREEKDLEASEKEPDSEASKPKEEKIKEENLDQKNNQEKHQESDTDGIKHFSLGGNDEDYLEEISKK